MTNSDPALAVRGVDIQALLMQAMTQHHGGRLDDAASLCENVLAMTPGNVDATHMLGVAALQRRKFPEAQRLIGAAVAASPRNIAALGNLGTSDLRNGQKNLAMHWFEIAQNVEPGSEAAA